MKAQQVESTTEEERGRETVAYPARDEEDLEQMLEQAHTVEDEETAEAVENINGVVDDELRGVVRNHFQAPIRSLNNPEENTVELEDGTEAQVVGEEYFVNQNLPGFQDVGNIKWWTVYDDGTYREETRNDRSGEHLNFNRDGELHGFHVELDGEPLDPEQTQRLARNLRIRRDNQVTTENNVPEMVIDHNNITEAVEASEEYDREDFESDYEEAQELGLVKENGNLTLKGWLSAVDMEARDIRELEEVANGQETIQFQNNPDTGLDLSQIATDGVVSINAEHPYMVDRSLNGRRERGRVNFRDGEMDDELEALMNDFSWMGLDSSQMTEEQEVSGEISFSQYLEDFHDVEAKKGRNGRIVIEKDQVNRFMFEELAKNATYTLSGEQNLVEEVDITNGQIQDFEKNLSVMRYSDEGENHRIDIEESDLPEEIIERIRDDFFESISIGTDREGVKVMYNGSSVGRGKSWDRLLDLHEGDEGEFEFDIRKNPLEIVLEPYQDEINQLQESYDKETDDLFGPDIPDFHKASDELLEGIREMEELGWFSTEIVEDSKTEIEVQASDPMEYRETIQKLQEIENLEFGSTYSMDKEAREARISWEENEKVPLDSVSANIEVAVDDEDKIRKRLEGYEEELEDSIYISTRRDLKDDIIPKIKHLVHEESGSNPVSQLFGKIVPEVDDYSDKERVKDYENLSGSIDYAEFTEDEEGAETWEKALSEELLEELGEMYEEGLIDVELDYDVRTSYESERVQMPDVGYVEDYHKVGDEDKEKLRELDEKGLISLDEGDYRIDVREELEVDEVVTVDGSATVEPNELEMDEEPVELEGEYRTTGEAVYEANQELRRIAENLDPFNFQKDSYEDIEFETDFEYAVAQQPATV